jgi:hypothetical protein
MAVKAWADLKPDYRKRLESKGITEANRFTPQAKATRQAARGHGKTPEHPDRAAKQPEKFTEYINRKASLHEAFKAKKIAMFGDQIKYKPSRSEKNANINPRTKKPPNPVYMRRFLAMTLDDVLLIDWSDDEWAILFYH